ncbi:MAG: DUF2975 domain-containing protein [Cellulosilyticaceae bacterium]
MKNNLNLKLLNGLVITGIALTVLALIATPLVITAAIKVSGTAQSPGSMGTVVSFCIYACAIPYLISLFKLKSICHLFSKDEPFSLKISKDFKVISICAFSEIFIFIGAELILWFGYGFYLYALTIVPLIIIPFICLTAGFMFLVLSNIFKKAAEIKEEVDLTF